MQSQPQPQPQPQPQRLTLDDLACPKRPPDPRLRLEDLDLDDRVVSLFAATKLRDDERNSDAVECDMARPTRCAEGWEMPAWLMRLGEMQEAGLGSVALLLATALSLGLANSAALSPAWLRFWATPVGRRAREAARARAAARGRS